MRSTERQHTAAPQEFHGSCSLTPHQLSLGLGKGFSTLNAELLIKGSENATVTDMAELKRLWHVGPSSHDETGLRRQERWHSSVWKGASRLWRNGRLKDAAWSPTSLVARQYMCLSVLRQPVLHQCAAVSFACSMGAASPAGSVLPPPPSSSVRLGVPAQTFAALFWLTILHKQHVPPVPNRTLGETHPSAAHFSHVLMDISVKSLFLQVNPKTPWLHSRHGTFGTSCSGDWELMD